MAHHGPLTLARTVSVLDAEGMCPAHPPVPGAHLRLVRDTDAPAVLDAFTSHPDMERQGEVHDLAAAATRIRWLQAPNVRAAAIADTGGTLIGTVAIHIDTENRTGWVSYWMHREHRGRGVTSRALAAVADRALRPEAGGGWGLERLELAHRVNNPASGGVARAGGFVREGVEREKFLIDGERVDVLTYGRLPSDPPPSTPHLPWRES